MVSQWLDNNSSMSHVLDDTIILSAQVSSLDLTLMPCTLAVEHLTPCSAQAAPSPPALQLLSPPAAGSAAGPGRAGEDGAMAVRSASLAACRATMACTAVSLSRLRLLGRPSHGQALNMTRLCIHAEATSADGSRTEYMCMLPVQMQIPGIPFLSRELLNMAPTLSMLLENTGCCQSWLRTKAANSTKSCGL